MVKISLNRSYQGKAEPSGIPQVNLEEWRPIIQQGYKDRKFFAAHHQDFFEKYPDMLVAIYREELVAVGWSDDDVDRQLADKGIPKKLVFVHETRTHKSSMKL